MDFVLVLPILLPLTTAALCLLAWRAPHLQRVFSIFGTLSLLVATLYLTTQVWRNGVVATPLGDYQAPFGIVLVADLLGATMTVLAALLGILTVVYSGPTMDARRVRFGYYPVLNILLMGVCGAFLTGDLFNLYVWFEVLLMASFVLLALGGERAQLEGAIKYVALNLLSSTLFLTALGILYGKAGTLNMADLAIKLRGNEAPEVVTALAMLFLVAFGIKAGLFPLFFWLPASYHTPPIAVSAIFGGLLTKVGVYALVRVFTLIFVGDVDTTHSLLLAMAGASMLVGVLGALAQTDVRRLLSFLIISQIGNMIMGLALLSEAALSGVVFYIVHHIVSETALFYLAGVLRRHGGSYDLRELGGFASRAPLVAILFFGPVLSLAGLPPLSGFFAKLLLLRAALEQEAYLIAGISLVAGLLTLWVLMRVWSEIFWKTPPETNEAMRQPIRLNAAMVAPALVLATISLTLGLAVAPMLTFAQRAGQQLADPSEYIAAVLGEDVIVAWRAAPTQERAR